MVGGSGAPAARARRRIRGRAGRAGAQAPGPRATRICTGAHWSLEKTLLGVVQVLMVGGSGAAAPERDDAFEAELAALVLKHQGRAPPAPAPVRVSRQEKTCWGLCKS